MKKLINAVENVVREQLQGMALAHPDLLKVHLDPYYVYRADAPVKGRWRWYRAEAAATSRCTGALWAWECWMAPAPARCLRRPHPTRCTSVPKQSIVARACC